MSNFHDGNPPPPGEPPPRRPNPDQPDGKQMPPWASPPRQPDQTSWGQSPGQPDKSDSPWKDQPQRQPGSPWQEPPSRQQPGQPGGSWQNQPPRQPGQPAEPQRSYHADNPTSGNSANEWAYEHPQAPKDEATAVMSTKDWVITYLLMMIPCVGLILTIIWAFGDTGNLNRKNYARAFLIIILIGIAFSILYTMLMVALGVSLIDSFY